MRSVCHIVKVMTSLCRGLLVTTACLMAAESTVISSAPQQPQADEHGVISGEGKFVIASQLIDLGAPQQLEQVRIRQSPAWYNWQPIEIGPKKKGAPILLPVADQQYWLFCGGHRYEAFFSSDMITRQSRGILPNSVGWATSAEWIDGQIYLYYDKPNDGDAHLVIGSIAGETIEWTPQGKVFANPNNGSDNAVIRTSDNQVHMILEDWSPIDPSQASWDSPLASHAISPDGKAPFVPFDGPPPVDERTEPTGEQGTFTHPAAKGKVFTYDKHHPNQDAFGDWTAIQIGDEFYLFGDFHPATAPHGRGKAVSKHMKIGMFHSDSINETFQFIGSFAKGHPDPTIGFAEGQFYLITQNKTSWVSPGPWTGTVRLRVGADTSGRWCGQRVDGLAGCSRNLQPQRRLRSRRRGQSRQRRLHALPISQQCIFEIEAVDADISSVEFISK